MSVATLANTTITIERPANTLTKGAITQSFAQVLRVRARVQPLSSEDRIKHSREESQVTHKVYVSGTPDIRAGDRIPIVRTAGTRYLYIHGARDIDEAGVFLTLECEERDR